MKIFKNMIFVVLTGIFFLLISYCGLPNVSQFDDLNPPTNLTITDIQTGEITIEFLCNNYEGSFEGYNIYIANYEEDIELNEEVDDHITVDSEGFLQVNTTIENKYIIKGEDGSLPTIKAVDILEYYNGLNSSDPLINLSQKSDACLGADNTELNIGDINPDSGEICCYELEPFYFEYDFNKLPDDSSIETINDYIILVTAYNSSYSIESNPSNSVNTGEYIP